VRGCVRRQGTRQRRPHPPSPSPSAPPEGGGLGTRGRATTAATAWAGLRASLTGCPSRGPSIRQRRQQGQIRKPRRRQRRRACGPPSFARRTQASAGATERRQGRSGDRPLLTATTATVNGRRGASPRPTRRQTAGGARSFAPSGLSSAIASAEAGRSASRTPPYNGQRQERPGPRRRPGPPDDEDHGNGQRPCIGPLRAGSWPPPRI
jgi:hypothetical protein